VRDVTIVS